MSCAVICLAIVSSDGVLYINLIVNSTLSKRGCELTETFKSGVGMSRIPGPTAFECRCHRCLTGPGRGTVWDGVGRTRLWDRQQLAGDQVGRGEDAVVAGGDR